jgi:NTP pyrophosphatase (non-canonical NTP hydrolase)
MNINVTEMTTTFPCPVNKLKGQLMDNINFSWETEFGKCILTPMSTEWIMQNVKTSQYTQDRCYIYNKAFARWFDNNDAYSRMWPHNKSHDKLGGNLKDVHMRNGLDNARDQYNGRTRSGALSPTGMSECLNPSHFDLIREWAEERGLYDKGDPKTQALKLVEEVGETCKAILKQDHSEIVDGIGDCVVVLTNLAELVDTSIEDCIEAAYNEIKDRKGKMVNGTYKKD